jgi:SAM-dependent methyltransferase
MEREAYDSLKSVEGSHWWFRGRRAILADQIARLGLPKDARILEVGCGAGGNLAMLGRFGAVTGVEPDGPSREHAAQATGAPVLPGTLPDGLPAFEGPFDLIAALDVIEHLDDDLGSLVALRGLLTPTGVLLTTVPAHPWLRSRHDDLHHHRRRYRKLEYLQLLARAGYSVRKASYFNTALFPVVALVRALSLSERVGSSDDALPPGPINAILARLFAAERFPLRAISLPFGVSLLVVARPA